MTLPVNTLGAVEAMLAVVGNAIAKCLKELLMTTADERTRAVLDTRSFLQTLARNEEVSIAGLIRTAAIGLLRHYPAESDLAATSAIAPLIWGAPKGRRDE